MSQCRTPLKQKRAQFLRNSTDYPYKSLVLEIMFVLPQEIRIDLLALEKLWEVLDGW